MIYKLTNLILLAVLFWACGEHTKPDVPEPTPQKIEGEAVIDSLWSYTTPLEISAIRMNLFNRIQGYADSYSNTAFKSLLTSNSERYLLTVKNNNLLIMYDKAFDKILNSLRTNKPKGGEVYVWQLYNMGYIIQTPSSAFGIDIYHYRAQELAPYLDFICSTHTHSDHKWLPLMDKMYQLGKPVLSNYYQPESNYKYTSLSVENYNIGSCNIHSCITRHNNGSTNVPVTVFQIDCGPESGGFVIVHSGDSNFTVEEYNITKRVDLYIPRYAQTPLAENKAISLLTPTYTLLSHILELGHKDISDSRWPLSYGIERMKGLDCKQSYMPFWGEKLIFNNKIVKQ